MQTGPQKRVKGIGGKTGPPPETPYYRSKFRIPGTARGESIKHRASFTSTQPQEEQEVNSKDVQGRARAASATT